MIGHLNRLLVSACALAILVFAARGATAQNTPSNILAAQLRMQGYRCEAPVTAERDAERSRPNEAAWTLKCANASYRMRLVPDMAARIEQLN
jgi:hypothetical protein